MPDLPIGTVTFLFTDMEGSTRLLQRLGDRFREVIDQHGRIIRKAIESASGSCPPRIQGSIPASEPVDYKRIKFILPVAGRESVPWTDSTNF